MFKKKFAYLVLFFVSILLINGNLQAQVKFAKTSYDMGIITGSPNDYIDITVKNTSKEKIFIFKLKQIKNSSFITPIKQYSPIVPFLLELPTTLTKKDLLVITFRYILAALLLLINYQLKE